MNRVGTNFLIPEMVRKYGLVGRYGGYITVTCYDRLIDKNWICPSPNNRLRSERAEDQYERGVYVSKQDYTLTKEQFDDPSFWQS